MARERPAWLTRRAVGALVLAAVLAGAAVALWARDRRDGEGLQRALAAQQRFQQLLLSRLDDHVASVHPAVAALSDSVAPRAAHAGAVVVRAGHRGAAQLCAYSEEEVAAALQHAHHCGMGEARYFLGGVWMDWGLLEREVSRDNDAGRVSCVLACSVRRDLQCQPHMPCVHAFWLRHLKEDTAALHVFYEKDASLPVLRADPSLLAILDAGAGVGVLSVLLAAMNPQATVVAVEAGGSSFCALQRNTAALSNVVAVRGGLWPYETTLHVGALDGRLTPAHSINAQAAEGSWAHSNVVLGLSGPFLLRFLALPRFDLVRISTRGNEDPLFHPPSAHDAHWLLTGPRTAIFDSHPGLFPAASPPGPTSYDRGSIPATFLAQHGGFEQVPETKGSGFIVLRRAQGAVGSGTLDGVGSLNLSSALAAPGGESAMLAGTAALGRS
ncbi:hypothetical protein CLOM_g12111 [Closterium sp. NIES-68]|nr:hypothetical protein CLOM_g12111 [Closterium sp. NIES-68]GJP58015.1 hypothetical protein CLOP_g20092 [Closterium sp. NIES-67]